MARVFLIVLGVIATALCGFRVGQESTELRWAQDREQSLIQQIESLKRKDREIANLKQSISVLNDSAVRVRERDAQIQRQLQNKLGNCSRFRAALEACSSTLSRCAEHAVSDRELIERCAIQLRR